MNPSILNRFLKDEGLALMKDAPDEAIVKFVMSYRSFDVAKLHHLLADNSDWASVILTHMHLDHVLDVFVNDYCVRPRSINNNSRRLSLVDKATFLHGVGVLSEGSIASVGSMNKLRNKFAHELKFEVSKKEVSEFRSAVYSAYGDRVYSRVEYAESECKKLPFKLLLGLAVLFVEEERLAFLLNGLRSARARSDLADALESARKSLGGN